MLKNMSVALCCSREMARFGALFLGECNNSFAFLVQGFRSDVRPVGPSDGASFSSCLTEEIAILEGRENGSTLQVFREINDSTRAIIKNDQETIVFFVLNLFDFVQIPYGSPQSNLIIFLISLGEGGSLISQAECSMGKNKNLPRMKMRSRAIAFRWFLARHLVGLV